MSVSVHPAALGLPPPPAKGLSAVPQPDGVDMVADTLAQHLGLAFPQPDSSQMPSELPTEEEAEDACPLLSHGQVMQILKDEDFTFAKTDCERVPGDPSTTFAAFAVFDGHNGPAAAMYSKKNLLKDIVSCMPPNLSREEWLTFLPRAIVAGFVKTDKEWQKLGQTSGTTATMVIVDGWTVTAACVGDSRCVLDAQGVATALTIDHRLDGNEEEKERIKASGGELARLKAANGIEVGPLRVWPGGLCLSRSIGDMDVGDYIVAVPHVKQIKLAPAGGRLIMASDGVWDAVSTRRAVKCCRGVTRPENAANCVVKEALRSRGLRDDTTCLVVDIAPRGAQSFAPAVKKQINIMRLLRRKSAKERDIASDLTIMEELFEENSAALSERLSPEGSVHAGNSLFLCASCRCNLACDTGISVHAGSFFAKVAGRESWEGPFMCAKCKATRIEAKPDAEEQGPQP